MAMCEREHVFPKCLYPASKSNSRVQRLTVPACRNCNGSWADDEAHFRNVLVLAGEDPNAVRKELWRTTTLRSFHKADGSKRVQDISAILKPAIAASNEQIMIFPAKDDRVLRVVRKIVRGLCYYHKVVSSPLSDQRVWSDVLKYTIPQEFLEQMRNAHREQDIVEYKWQVLNEEGINSVWLITFFERVTFIGLVSISESGFA
jgi:hypothetical protein